MVATEAFGKTDNDRFFDKEVKRVLRMNNFLKSCLVAMTAFAATASFANNREVLQLAQVSDGFNAEQKYMASCFACHSTGAAGAPKVGAGMMSEWEPRLEKGLDAVVANAVNGVNAMPAKGLCFDCNEDDIRALVEYMLETSQ